VPPLRDRSDDVCRLAEHFIRLYAARYGRNVMPLAPGTAAALQGHAWPGNVRELENVVHRAFLLCTGPVLHIPELERGRDRPPEAAETAEESTFARAKAEAIVAFERSFLIRALARTNGNVTLAAQISGKERRSFGKLLKKHGIDRVAYGRPR
jgi:two-component system, NtrC family, response regulator GlrR